MSTSHETTPAAARTNPDARDAALDAAGATQQKAGETGAVAQDKGIQVKEGAGNMLAQAEDAVRDAATKVTDSVNPNKSG